MRLLLDEGMPVQLLEPLRRNAPHTFEHIDDLGWKSKNDDYVFRDAANGGFDGIVVLDVDQLTDRDLCRALNRSGLHHLSLRQGRSVKGRTGVARVIASVVVAMPYILTDLEGLAGQRLVEITLLSSGARHEALDPRRERQRFPYWPN
jgi:hypothetical protein